MEDNSSVVLPVVSAGVSDYPLLVVDGDSLRYGAIQLC